MVNIIIVRLNSLFLEVTIPGKSQFLGSHIFGKVFSPILTNPCNPTFSAGPGKVTFAGKSNFLGRHLSKGNQVSQEVQFPEKSNSPAKSHFQKNYIPRSHISQDVTFSGSYIFWKLTHPGKSYFPGSHIFFEITFPGKSNFQKVTFYGISHFNQKFISSRKFTSSTNFTFSGEIASGNSHIP